MMSAVYSSSAFPKIFESCCSSNNCTRGTKADITKAQTTHLNKATFIIVHLHAKPGFPDFFFRSPRPCRNIERFAHGSRMQPCSVLSLKRVTHP